MEAERTALDHLREALKHMRIANASPMGRTRELSVALTQCETALLWLEHDYHVKLSKGEEPLRAQPGDKLTTSEVDVRSNFPPTLLCVRCSQQFLSQHDYQTHQCAA